jgi:hypothetical protein
VPRPDGEQGTWELKTVRNILKNKAYAGYAHAGMHAAAGYRRAKNERDTMKKMDAAEVAGALPVIVTLDEWERSSAKVQDSRTKNRRPRTNQLSTLSGVVRCPACGNTMTTKRYKGAVFYECSKIRGPLQLCEVGRVYESDLLPLVVGKLIEVLDRKTLELASAEAEDGGDEAERIERLKAKLDTLQRRAKEGSKRVLTAPEVLRAGLEAALIELHEEVTAAEAELEAVTLGRCRETAEAVTLLRDQLIELAPAEIDWSHINIFKFTEGKDSPLPKRDHYLVKSPAIEATPERLRAFLKRLDFRVVPYFKKRGAGRYYSLDAARLEATIDLGGIDSREGHPTGRGPSTSPASGPCAAPRSRMPSSSSPTSTPATAAPPAATTPSATRPGTTPSSSRSSASSSKPASPA